MEELLINNGYLKGQDYYQKVDGKIIFSVYPNIENFIGIRSDLMNKAVAYKVTNAELEEKGIAYFEYMAKRCFENCKGI